MQRLNTQNVRVGVFDTVASISQTHAAPPKNYTGHYCFQNPVRCLLERRLKGKFSVSIVVYVRYYRRAKYERFLSFPSLATQNSRAIAACAAVVYYPIRDDIWFDCM